ncbi:MAG: tape measure protein [Verrucomicrobiota bacterium]
MAESIGDLFLRIRATAAGLAGDLNRDLSAARNSLGAQSVAIGNLISSGIQSGLGSLKNFLTEQIGSAINQAADSEMTSVMFKVLLGDAEKAKKALAEIRILDQQSPLSFNALAEGGKQLLAMGISAEEMIPTMSLLGEVSLGNSERFGRLVYAFGQISSLGRLAGTELRQLTELGFNPLEYIAKRTGETMAQLTARMSDGKISIREVRQAFMDATSPGGRFFGALEEGAKTFTGKMSKLTGTISAGMINIGTGINSALKPVIEDITKEIGNLGPSTRNIGAEIGKWGTEIYKSAGGMKGIVDWLVDAAAKIATCAQFAGVMASAIGTGLTTATSLGITLFEGFKLALKGCEVFIRGVSIGIRSILAEWGEGIHSALNGLKNGGLKVFNDLETAATIAAANIAKALQPKDAWMFDIGIDQLKIAQKNFDPKKVVADLPAGSAPNSPSSLLFPNGPEEIDFSAFEAGIDDFTSTAVEANKVIQNSAEDTGKKLNEIHDGDFLGDRIRQQYALESQAMQHSVTTAQTGAAQVLAVEQTAAKARIDLNSEEMKAKKKAHLDAFVAQYEAQEEIRKANQQTYDQFKSLNRDTVTDIVSAWATGTGKISDIVSQWANQMIRQFIQLALFGNKTASGGGSITGLVGSLAGSAGGTGGWVSALGSLMGGFFADGGRPPMGKISVVGERGPELFVPDSAGRIIPNHQAAASAAPGAGGGGSGGGGAHIESPIVIHQTFTTGVTAHELAGAMDQMQDATRGAVLDAVRRGGGYRRGMQS